MQGNPLQSAAAWVVDARALVPCALRSILRISGDRRGLCMMRFTAWICFADFRNHESPSTISHWTFFGCRFAHVLLMS